MKPLSSPTSEGRRPEAVVTSSSFSDHLEHVSLAQFRLWGMYLARSGAPVGRRHQFIPRFRTAGSLAEFGVHEDDVKNAKEKEQMIWRWLLGLRDNMPLFNVVLKILALDAATHMRLGELDQEMNSLFADGVISAREQFRLRQILDEKHALEEFHDTTLREHREAVLRDPPPDSAELAEIENSIETHVERFSGLKRLYNSAKAAAGKTLKFGGMVAAGASYAAYLGIRAKLRERFAAAHGHNGDSYDHYDHHYGYADDEDTARASASGAAGNKNPPPPSPYNPGLN